MPDSGSPLVSVILPVYNGERHLADCVHSVLRQTLADFELIVGDDASTDNSSAILARLPDSRIRLVQHAKNLGLFKNVNRLIMFARAPLVHFLCQDDCLEPSCLSEEAQFFGLHPQIGMSFCKSLIIDEKGDIIETSALNDLPTVLPSTLSLQHLFFHGCIPGNLSAVCARADMLRSVGLFDETLSVSGDYEMWVRICAHSSLGVIHQHLFRQRRHPEQLSRAPQSGVMFIRENRRIRAMLFDQLPTELRQQASIFTRLRLNVLETHFGVYCLTKGRFHTFFETCQAMGTFNFALGILLWIATVNNRLWRPHPRFLP